MDINDKSIEEGAPEYYDKGFMDVLEAHMPYLRASKGVRTILVDAREAVVHDGYLNSYLTAAGFEQHKHWVIMRASNMFSPNEFNRNTTYLVLPDFDEINKIRQTYKSKSKPISI